MDRDTLLFLFAGAYLFAGGSYLFGWKILTLLWNLRVLVTNHQTTEIAELKRRIAVLEAGIR